MSDLLVLPLGEAAITIRLGEVASVELAQRSAALAAALRAEGIDGVREVVPAVASVAVFFDPTYRLAVDAGYRARVAEQMRAIALRPQDGRTARAHLTHTIPTRYNGPDLDDVAERVNLKKGEVITGHTSREYHVLALGFLPGWAYLGALDPALALPRKSTPRTRVPAGSVAIMGTQTGIYPRETPGGWHLIGSTDVVLFDAARTPPALFRAGDRVRFASIVE